MMESVRMQAGYVFVKEQRMSTRERGLGRGLDALFRNSESAPGEPQRKTDVSLVHVDALAPNPKQPRRHFADEALEELAASIRSQGIVQPLLVRPSGNARYEIVAGERRWRAARLAGLTELPVLVRDLTDMEVMAAALIENLQREDLKPLEEARAMATLREQFGLSQEDLASTLGKSRPAVANALRLLNLSAEAQAELESGRISPGHARAILSLSAPEAQSRLLHRIVQESLTVRDAEYAATLYKEEGLFPWEQTADDEQAAQEGEDVRASSKKSQRRAASPFLLDVQSLLREKLHVRAGVSGTEARGRISLNYQSREELDLLLSRLGIEIQPPAAS